MIEVKTKLTMKLPDLDFTQTFQDIAKNIICPDMRGGINRGIGVDGNAFPPLEPGTIARKTGARKSARRRGLTLTKAGLAGGRGGSQTLVDKGILRESFDYERVGRNHVRIFVGGEREKIAKYLQIDGVGKKKKKFNFFGISQRAEFQSVAKMRARLGEILERSNGG